ncbi:uncharacterized protein LOC103931390 [Pyrus x bretschneideri]|uniref:uncharacterized protein LOC103931390 n=1 Tax=Pyrus x bretschneideri TaxID=225117 RepID=UPI000510F8C0|nr:uncharacterized protein LOC103931390 [Pyrus x bretschneideri]
MSTAKASNKKRRTDPEIAKSDHLDLDLDLSNDIKGIMSAIHQIREKAHKDGLKKNEETISSVAAEVRSAIDELKSKLEKDRQSFAKSLSKSSKECENCLKTEAAKFQALHEKFCKDQASHLQALKGVISTYEEEKERLCTRYEQLRKRERSMISEHEKACADKINKLEESLKKKKQDDRTFSVLRKSLGSILDNGSDEDIPADD